MSLSGKEDAALAALRLSSARPKNRSERIERYRFRAAVLRDTAEELRALDTKIMLHTLAATYDHMATMLEHPC